MAATWRNMSAGDMQGLMRVADEVHPGLPESERVFAERVRLFPEGCLALADGDNNIRGYAISHPIRRRNPPALDSMLGDIAPDADQYYIHDLAILPGSRGLGLAAECMATLLAVGERYPTTCLVSVYGTVPFWGRFGFASEPVDATLQEKLRAYGDDAVYLVRQSGPAVDR
ncbi:hypothetical protein B0T26DRAFT_640601 [Lasiosphaeria miniovina]|uniref:N-acetyltransferase domain-containing protein n=1 Tax=Lasiosphaeria miniovina TaxID=1954250 RepID=A0AA40AVE8_9PEZI|nr:uncharacterized protein B0T26DRAFT_640601 [Lasiosphaeria miniovina]KAK0722663.1 hypothetical protein B0T26DRAFT_640601 [Lasiosphaeria miniovina]